MLPWIDLLPKDHTFIGDNLHMISPCVCVLSRAGVTRAGARTGLQLPGRGDTQGFDSSSPALVAHCLFRWVTALKCPRTFNMSGARELLMARVDVRNGPEELLVSKTIGRMGAIAAREISLWR